MTRVNEARKRPQPQPAGRMERETAWDLWRKHAREDVLMSDEDKALMMERHKLVVSIIDVNSRQLRCDSARAGLDIERACALRDAKSPDLEADAKARLEAIEQRMAALAREQQKLASEREFLDSALADFDAAAPPADERVGRA